MTIHPAPKRGRNRADVVCEGCGRVESVTCDYVQQAHAKQLTPNEGQINRKITSKGWELIRGRHFCPVCVRARTVGALVIPGAEPSEEPMPKAPEVQALREPTREMKRQIVALLDVAYDVAAGRYKGADTDKVLADAVGGGCLPGWVAELREAMYGPDGANAEIVGALSEVREALAASNKCLDQMAACKAEVTRLEKAAIERRDRLMAMEKRLVAIVAAVGPKAERVA